LYQYGDDCRRTDGDDVDRYALGERRTNLSQFSFKSDIVKNGYRELVLWPFRFRSAFAGDERAADKHVQIRDYHTDGNGLDCVRFKAVIGPGAFLRINDLEKRTLLGGDNKTWDWPLR
jgi:hypothetical protein